MALDAGEGGGGASGLSQPVAALSLGDAPPPPGLAAPPPGPRPPTPAAHQPAASGDHLIQVSLGDLRQFLEEDTLRHFDLVRSAVQQDPQAAAVAVVQPARMRDLEQQLRRQGYRVDARDPWALLGFSPLCGSEPTEGDITSRARSASLLLSLAEGGGWSMDDVEAARRMQSAVQRAAALCAAGLPEVRRARRQLKPDKLPRWKELGEDAVQAVLATPGAEGSTFVTQWSQVLAPLGPHAAIVDKHRRVSDLLEKGDGRFLAETRGGQVVAWAPAEAGSLSRILASFLRQDPADGPTALLFIVPLPAYPGARTVEHFTDLWTHPLLSKKHAALVKHVSFLPQPVEYVLPGGHGPRHVRQGLACFKIGRLGACAPPALVYPRRALVQTDGAVRLVVDLPSAQLPLLLRGLAGPEFADLLIRDPTRSIGSTAEVPRMTLSILLPVGMTALGIEMLVRRLRRQALTADMAVGSSELYTADDALILECHSPTVLPHALPYRSEALLTADRILVRAEVAPERWIELMDRLCREGEFTLISKLRWKASRFGGRPYASPTATRAALAASRRRRGRQGQAVQQTDFVTELRVNGEAGRRDRAIFDGLMAHLTQSVGLQLRAFSDDARQDTGVWKHLASYDDSAPPGRARLYLSSREEVQRVYGALHGQLVQVGADWLAVTVHNDLREAAPLGGNGDRML